MFSARQKVENDPIVRYIKMIAEDPLQPLHMLPPGTYPDVEK